jgi:outer membrane biosynthesis protein TonB
MKPLRLKTVLLSLASIALVFSGCSQKKPVLVVPRERPIAGAPTPSPTPEVQQSVVTPTPEATPEPTPAVADQAQVAPQKKKHHISKPSPSVKSNPETGTTQANGKKTESTTEAKAVPDPKATPGLIAPTISASDAVRDQNAAEQLLQSTETNLNNIGKRQLSSEEQTVVSNIKNFIMQSRQALKDNDPARARNLASKANVLSNDLIKSR